MVVNEIVWHWWGMARDDLHFRLRIPEELKREVEASAAQNNRSMTAEIVERVAAYPGLRQFWAKADAEIARLEGQVGDADERRRQIKALKEEAEQLRLEVARLEGYSTALQQGQNVFTHHLARAASGERITYEEIKADLDAMNVPKGKPE